MPVGTGTNMKLYYNTASTGTPTWVLVDEIGDVTMTNFSRGSAELKRRGKKFIKSIPTLISPAEIQFSFIHGLGATAFAFILAEFLAGTVKEWAMMDGLITGGGSSGNQGLRLPAFVMDFPWNQPLEDVSQHDIKLQMGYMIESTTEIDPSWYTVP
jgi:hypothetical protein